MSPDLPPLTPDLWARVRDAYSALSDLSDAEQTAELEQLEQSENAVAQHVAAMLRVSGEQVSLDEGFGEILGDLFAPNETEVPQQAFGPYRLVRPLGRGGMGVVYLGKRDDLGSLAAIKILPHAWVDPSRHQQFVEEMRILAELSHESIAGMLHAGQLDDGTPWFAMQYVEGEPITTWVWRGRLSADETLRLFDKLCAAVQHAHGYPIVHRDIKPSNVLVTDGGAVKLLDFGIAKRLRDLQFASDRPRTITREVTVEYAAPEQLRGQTVGVRADVYALGILLFELLSGRRPYEISNLPPADAEAVIRAAYPWSLPTSAQRESPEEGDHAAAALRADERRDLTALICKATAPDAVDRYGSVAEIRLDLRAYLERRPLTARQAGWAYRARKFVRRERRALSVTALVVAAGITGLALHNRSLRTSRDAAIAEAERTTRLRQYLEDLFQGGGVTSGPPDSIRVATIVENGIRDARDLSSDPAVQIDLLGTLGIMTQRMGALDRADSLFRFALERSSEFYGPDHPETLRSRLRRAALLAQRGSADSAEHILRSIDSLARRYAAARHPVATEADIALGVLLRDRARYAEALPYLERAVTEQAARDSTSREFVTALRELGNALGSQNNLPRADSLWRRALPIARRVLGPRHPDVGFLLANLGNTASRRGQLADAERFQREAVDISRSWYGEDHYLTAAPMGVLAQTLIRLKRYDDAIPIIRKVIDVFSRSPDIGPASPNTSISRSTLATALAGRGDHAEATREFETALAGVRKSLGEKNTNTITIAGSLAMELLHAGKVDTAIALLRNELAIGHGAYGDDVPVVAETRIRLGQALIAKHQFAEAISLTTAGLRVVDAKYGQRASSAQLGRRNLIEAYLATGDSANAARLRAQLADTARKGS